MDTLVKTTEKKAVKISLMQTNKEGKINASFVFNATGENFDNFLTDTAQKINKVFELQQKIKENKGKSNMFGLTKNGDFELNITTVTEEGSIKLLNNFVFNVAKIGNLEINLPLMVEGFKLLTE